MKHTDHCGNIHWNHYGKSDKVNAFDNQNADFQEGYAWGVETYAYDAQVVLKTAEGAADGRSGHQE